jgi:hypothetical protein
MGWEIGKWIVHAKLFLNLFLQEEKVILLLSQVLYTSIIHTKKEKITVLVSSRYLLLRMICVLNKTRTTAGHTTSRRYLLRVNESQQQKLCSRFATATTTRRCWFLLQACALRTMWRHGLVFLGTLQTTTRRCSFHLQPPLSITSRRPDLPRLSYEYLVYLAYSNISPRHNTWKIYTKHFYNITLWHAGEVINGTARRLHIYCCNIRMESWV